MSDRFDHFFAGPGVLISGALVGLVFGFLLQKGGLTRYRVIMGQFLLADFTMLKTMLTAIVVGAIGIYGMRAMGLEVPLHIKTAEVAANVAGGAIFGAGMVILGYCPGTGVAAMGDGSRHAIYGVLGMLAGAAVYAEVQPWLAGRLAGMGNLGKATFDSVSTLSPWWFIAGLAVLAAGGLYALERWEQENRRPVT
jgi:hypothetical protein